ncbi:putative DNA-binding protein [Vallitalea sediminicola]
MSNIFKKTLLYDFYGELLTKHQKEIYELYHLNDFSLGEIAEQLKISRQGVHDTLKRCEKQLENYESKLQLVDKFLINKQNVEKICNYASEIFDSFKEDKKSQEIVADRIADIQETCNRILENL